MRFLALLRKELRESLPWILLSATAFLAIGSLLLREAIVYHRYDFYISSFSRRSAIDTYWFTQHPPISPTGSALFVISIGLGLSLGIRQFLVPHFTGTWPFLIHRSTGKKTILSAKFTAAALGFIVSLGVIWSAFFWYASQPGIFTVPPALRFFFEGWFLLSLGFLVYIGTALVALSRKRWYATKIFPLAFVTIAICMVILQWNLIWAFIVLIISALILLTQITHTFSNREF